MKNLFFNQTAKNINKHLFEKFINEAGGYLNLELLNEGDLIIPGVQHGKYFDASRPFEKAGMTLGTAYRLTGDKKYANKMKELMLHYAGYKYWKNPSDHRKSELNNASFCCGMSAGFNLCYDIFTEEERQVIAKAVYEKGIEPIFEEWLGNGTRIHALDTMGHNWWIVLVSQAGLAALVFSDELPKLKSLAKTIAEKTKYWFYYKGNPVNAKPSNFDNGGFYESLVYLDFSLREYCLFRNAYEIKYKRFLWDDNKILSAYADFIIETFYPKSKNGMSVGFGDNGQGTFLFSVPMLLKAGIDSPRLRWYIKKWEERVSYVYDIIYYDLIYNMPSRRPKGGGSKIWENIGWAVMRDSYKDNARMLAVKSGDTWNHAHADAGHFIFFNNGYEEIYDSGSCPYVFDEYREYYRESKAHNVVLFNGNGQDSRDIDNHVRSRGALYNLVNCKDVKYVVADASGPMGRYFRRHLRHFLWLNDTILIYDDIEAYIKGELNWTLHTDNPDCLEVLYPIVTLKEHWGYKDKEHTKKVKYYSYDAQTDNDCRGKFVSVIKCGKENISFEEIKDGFKITIGDWTVYINTLSDGSIMHKNCINTMEEYTTDAVMLAVHRNEYFISNASFVRKEGKSIYENLFRETKKI